MTTLTDLLKLAGARLRSAKRADCLRCGGRRTIAFTDETFYCHHAGCGWSGNAITLARELGAQIKRPSGEDITRQRLVRAEADRVRRFAEMRWRFLRDLNWLLLDVERLARESGKQYLDRGEPVPESVWANLDWSLREQEKLWPELVLFSGPESGSGQAARWAETMLERYLSACTAQAGEQSKQGATARHG